MRIVLPLLLMLFAMAAPARDEIAPHGDWRLVLLQDGDVVFVPVSGSRITLSLSEDHTCNGSSGVNRYFGSCMASGDGYLSWGPLASTRIAGPPELMNREFLYLSLLARADTWECLGNRLILSSRAEDVWPDWGGVRLEFIQADLESPSVEYRSPSAGKRIRARTTHRGAVTDEYGVRRVEFRVQGGRPNLAQSFKNGRWAFRIPRSEWKRNAGARIAIEVVAIDRAGNRSNPVQRSFRVRRHSVVETARKPFRSSQNQSDSKQPDLFGG